ncbi:hypothetical protein WA026_016185 [Henosepilachna vigintioctopunctata]|uniref:S1-like domain-containing protein n=1 Tax=Henosepilachna vigintioctopunctata TaxID=420089 RepID=A0AAW1TVL4_9CUCU
MPKNTGKGGKNYKRRKSQKKVPVERELAFKEDGMEYAQVTKMLGHCTLEAMCCDGKKRLCYIRGRIKNRVWIEQSDYILIGLRSFQDARADVIWKYTTDEVLRLQAYGEIPESVESEQIFTFVDEDLDEYIRFGYDNDLEDEDIEDMVST